jgi:hypothetical protein
MLCLTLNDNNDFTDYDHDIITDIVEGDVKH